LALLLEFGDTFEVAKEDDHIDLAEAAWDSPGKS
jgi:hypothetical protein